MATPIVSASKVCIVAMTNTRMGIEQSNEIRLHYIQSVFHIFAAIYLINNEAYSSVFLYCLSQHFTAT